eukprot:3595137-Rhodomonas_salina.3
MMRDWERGEKDQRRAEESRQGDARFENSTTATNAQATTATGHDSYPPVLEVAAPRVVASAPGAVDGVELREGDNPGVALLVSEAQEST